LTSFFNISFCKSLTFTERGLPWTSGITGIKGVDGIGGRSSQTYDWTGMISSIIADRQVKQKHSYQVLDYKV